MLMEHNLIDTIIDGTYRITEKLGEGGMGVVYKAWDQNLRKNWALKMLRAELAADEQLVERFKNESIMQASLDHPNIVHVVVSKLTDAGLIIVMEYVEGKTLAKFIEDRGTADPLSLKRVKAVFEQLLKAFEYAHTAMGMVHRDIKPQNIIMKKEDFVKITDFGLAKIQGDSRVGGRSSFIRAGTLEYMSPEQVIGPLSRVDLRGDIYSLGVTLAECATGKLPFPDPKNGEDVQDRILEGKLLPLREIKSDLPEQLEAVVRKATARDKADRFQTAREMWEALSRVPEEKADLVDPGATVLVDINVDQKNGRKLFPWRKVLTVSVAAIAAILILMKMMSGPQTRIQTISVSSSPPEAGVYVNERLIGVTPIEGEDIQLGVIKLRIAKPGFLSRDTNLFIREGDKPKLRFVLPPVQGTTVSVRSEPSGARISLGGNVIGVTPMDSYSIKIGQSILKIEKEGYQPRDIAMVMRQGQDTSVFVQLVQAPRPARVTLAVADAGGGSVLVDGSPRQLGTFEVEPGNHTVTFRHPQFGSKEFPVTLRPGENRKLTCYFMGYISVNAEPFGYLWIDGKSTVPLVETPRDRYPLPPGKHKVTVKRAGYKTVEGEVEVNVEPALREQVNELAFTLVLNR